MQQKRKAKSTPHKLSLFQHLLRVFVFVSGMRLLYHLAWVDAYILNQVCLLLISVILLFFLGLTVLYIRGLLDRHHFIPWTLLFSAAAVLAFLLPLPPQNRMRLPEPQHFLDHREDFEAVVELARQEALEPIDSECYGGYILPNEYAHVSATGCIIVRQSDTYGLQVQFNPLDRTFYHVLVYTEPEKRLYECPGNYFVQVIIDENWAACFEDWN